MSRKLGAERNARRIDLAVDWSPVYEFLISFGAYVHHRLHPILELGPAWARRVRHALPAAYVAQLDNKTFASEFKEHHQDLLCLLFRSSPQSAHQNTASFMEWLAGLSAGDAYEAVAPRMPDTGPQLPREFVDWRDHYVDLLRGWEQWYFRGFDAAILEGLRNEAESLRTRLGSAPALDLVEQVTNGMCVDPTPAFDAITLVPQYHERPYNHDFLERDGVVILYPADVLPSDPTQPPARLVRLTRALSDESRLRILRFLSTGTRSLTEVARFARLSQPTVHHHLAQLRAAGLVRVQYAPGVPTPNRYSLRSHALEQLAQQLGTYLEPLTPSEVPARRTRA